MSPPLLPDPIGEPTQETPVRRTVYNRPAWMVRGQQDEDTEIPEDASRKKSRAWVFTADMFTTPAANINPPMWTMDFLGLSYSSGKRRTRKSIYYAI